MIVAGPGYAAALQGRFTEVANSAFCSGFNEILIVGAVVAVVGAVLGFALTRERDFVSHGAAAEPAHA